MESRTSLELEYETKNLNEQWKCSTERNDVSFHVILCHLLQRIHSFSHVNYDTRLLPDLSNECILTNVCLKNNTTVKHLFHLEMWNVRLFMKRHRWKISKKWVRIFSAQINQLFTQMSVKIGLGERHATLELNMENGTCFSKLKWNGP